MKKEIFLSLCFLDDEPFIVKITPRRRGAVRIPGNLKRLFSFEISGLPMGECRPQIRVVSSGHSPIHVTVDTQTSLLGQVSVSFVRSIKDPNGLRLVFDGPRPFSREIVKSFYLRGFLSRVISELQLVARDD